MHETIPLQQDMFSQRWVDTRSSHQKRLDKEREKPRQMIMFPVKEMVQFGEQSRPWLKQLPAAPLVLENEDPRTLEEKEQDLLRIAQSLTPLLFQQTETKPEAKSEPSQAWQTLAQAALALAEQAMADRSRGYRRYARDNAVRLRRR